MVLENIFTTISLICLINYATLISFVDELFVVKPSQKTITVLFRNSKWWYLGIRNSPYRGAGKIEPYFVELLRLYMYFFVI